MSSQNLVLGG